MNPRPQMYPEAGRTQAIPGRWPRCAVVLWVALAMAPGAAHAADGPVAAAPSPPPMPEVVAPQVVAPQVVAPAVIRPTAQSLRARQQMTADEKRWRAADRAVQVGGYLLKRDPEKALDAYRRATELDPENLDAWWGVADVYGRLQWPDQMVAPLTEILVRGEARATRTSTASAALAARRLGSYFLNNRRRTEAEAMYEAALRLYRAVADRVGMATVYSNLGTLFAVRKDWDSAARNFFESLTLNEALQRTEGMAINYESLGRIYAGKGARISALSMYTKARDLYLRAGRKGRARAVDRHIAALESG